MPDWVTVLIAVVGALGGSSGIAALLSQRKQVEANAAARLTEAASGLVDDLREEIRFLRRQADVASAQLKHQQDELRTLQETLDHAVARLSELEMENRQLKRRVSELENENRCLQEKFNGAE